MATRKTSKRHEYVAKPEKKKPVELSMSDVREKAFRDVKEKAVEIYNCTSVLPRIRELLAWMDEEIQAADGYEASDSNSAVEGDDL